jgi:hypothetical protein
MQRLALISVAFCAFWEGLSGGIAGGVFGAAGGFARGAIVGIGLVLLMWTAWFAVRRLAPVRERPSVPVKVRRRARKP